MQTTLTTLAKHESRPVDELIPDLLAAGLTQYDSTDELWKKWDTLTRREREVAGLACLEYTNREIAARLHISPETVKTRLQNTLKKFNLHSRDELRIMLVAIAKWDFSTWERLNTDDQV